jgi:TrmH family RNA methyltransferase
VAERVALTSATNPRVKAIRRLRDRREREETGLTIVDGMREIGRALDADAEIVEAFIDPDRAGNDDGRLLVQRLRATSVRVIEVGGAVADRLAFGDRSEGIVAIVRVPDRQLADLALPDNPLLVVIEAVEKPGNLGAILRTADGAGVDAVIAADPRTDLWNPNAIRASLGTIFRIPLAAATSADAREWLTARDIRIVAARVDGTHEYTATDLATAVAVVLGSEAEGLSAVWSGAGVETVSIPMHGLADSLNVSVAAAVLLYEARRQRDRATVDSSPAGQPARP